MKLRRRFLTRRTILNIKSYPDLYRELILFTRQDWLWLFSILFLAANFWYATYYIVILPQAYTATLIIGIVEYIAFLVLIVLIFFLAYSATQNPSRSVPEIIAHMLIFYRKPYRRGLGLGLLDYEDIQLLKRIAEIEQNSADWRSSYVNFGIISIVAALIANPQLIWNYLILPVLETVFLSDEKLPSPFGTNLPQQSYSESLIAAFLFVLIVLWLLYKWVSYFRDFISSEYANRAVLLACEELLALYRVKNLPTNRQMPLHERRAMLEIYGYKLVKDEKATINERMWAPIDLGEYGLWILVPPEKYSIEVRIDNILKRLLNRIRGGKNR